MSVVKVQVSKINLYSQAVAFIESQTASRIKVALISNTNNLQLHHIKCPSKLSDWVDYPIINASNVRNRKARPLM